MTVLLTLLSVLAALVLFTALAGYLVLISKALGAIGGGPTSLLAKIRFGLRAIEQQTAALGPQVGRLNQGLSAAAEGMEGIAQAFASTVEALKRQRG